MQVLLSHSVCTTGAILGDLVGQVHMECSRNTINDIHDLPGSHVMGVKMELRQILLQHNP